MKAALSALGKVGGKMKLKKGKWDVLVMSGGFYSIALFALIVGEPSKVLAFGGLGTVLLLGEVLAYYRQKRINKSVENK
jgi:hypothetical protein